MLAAALLARSCEAESRAACISPRTATIPGPTRPRPRTRATGSDSAALADRKWERVLRRGRAAGAGARRAARSASPIARQVAFAPNTHEFVARIYSCLDAARPLRVLTSAHEFHSFRRQTRRLQEAGRVEVDGDSRPSRGRRSRERFAAAARSAPWDLVWLSHVFFDSGFVVPDLEAIVRRGARGCDRRHRRLPRVLRAARGPRAHPPARVLPRRRLQVRDGGRRRVLPRGAAGLRRCVPSIRAGSRRSTRSSVAPGERGALRRRRVPLLGRDLRSVGPLPLQRRDGLARRARAPRSRDVHRHCDRAAEALPRRRSRASALARLARREPRAAGRRARAATSSRSTSTTPRSVHQRIAAQNVVDRPPRTGGCGSASACIMPSTTCACCSKRCRARSAELR